MDANEQVSMEAIAIMKKAVVLCVEENHTSEDLRELGELMMTTFKNKMTVYLNNESNRGELGIVMNHMDNRFNAMTDDFSRQSCNYRNSRLKSKNRVYFHTVDGKYPIIDTILNPRMTLDEFEALDIRKLIILAEFYGLSTETSVNMSNEQREIVIRGYLQEILCIERNSEMDHLSYSIAQSLNSKVDGIRGYISFYTVNDEYPLLDNVRTRNIRTALFYALGTFILI